MAGSWLSKLGLLAGGLLLIGPGVIRADPGSSPPEATADSRPAASADIKLPDDEPTSDAAVASDIPGNGTDALSRQRAGVVKRPPARPLSQPASLIAVPRPARPDARGVMIYDETFGQGAGTTDPAAAPDALLQPTIRLVNGAFVAQPQSPTQQPLAPSTTPAPMGEGTGASSQPVTAGSQGVPSLNTSDIFGALDTNRTAQASAAAAPASAAGSPTPSPEISGVQERIFPTSNVVEAFRTSDTSQNVTGQLRNPISLDPRIRGYRYGEIYTQIDGADWVPARQDLDTPISMISPSVIQTATAIPGPFAVQYGPGFSFLDVQTAPTPRYSDGTQIHAAVGAQFTGNGSQLNEHEQIYGGSDDWGGSIFHNTRFGSDYRSGNGDHIPTAYHAQNFFAQAGYSFDQYTRLEFRYLRQDLTNTQIPGQFFKLDSSGTNGFNLDLTSTRPDRVWTSTRTQGWYNQTSYAGSTDPGETYFNVVGRVEDALDRVFGVTGIKFSGITTGNTFTTGGRRTYTLGDEDNAQLVFGADARYIQQEITEKYTLSNAPFLPPHSPGINMLPKAYSVDPGIFLQLAIPITSYWKLNAGTRMDWVQTGVFNPSSTMLPEPGTPIKGDILSAFFATNTFQLTQAWTGRVGFGSAQRPPTLTERYADNLFIAVAQDGFTKVIGNPNQVVSRNFQVDASLEADYDWFRGRVSAFQSWINNFSTFIASPVADPTGARIFYTAVTPWATLSGIEGYAEADLTQRLTAFGGLYFVSGRDQTISQPLTQIYPLDSRLGLRIHDENKGARWGFEAYERMVAAQNQLGTLRSGAPGDVTGLYTAEQRTPGFAITNLRGYWNATKRLTLSSGINNLFNTNYLEHLSLRLPADKAAGPPASNFPAAAVYSPGFTFYINAEWVY